MKLSSHTTSVLKNFATINQNLVIKEGNSIATMSAMKNIVAKAEVEETFPQEIAIYDLNEFLGALSLFSSPILDFNDNYVVISEESKPTTKMKYFYSDPSVVTSPSKMITMPSEEVKFTMSNDDLSKLKRAAGAIGAPDMVLERKDNISSITVKDKKNDIFYEFFSLFKFLFHKLISKFKNFFCLNFSSTIEITFLLFSRADKIAISQTSLIPYR